MSEETENVLGPSADVSNTRMPQKYYEPAENLYHWHCRRCGVKAPMPGIILAPGYLKALESPCALALYDFIPQGVNSNVLGQTTTRSR